MHNRIKSFVVAEHSIKNNHYMCMEQAKFIATEDHYRKSRIREVVEIEKHPKNFNKDDVLVISGIWKSLIQKLRDKEIIG